MDLSGRLKELRSLKQWTQQDLSDHSGVSIDSIKGYEAGKTKNITIDNLKKISNAFGIDILNFSDKELKNNNGVFVTKSSLSQKNNVTKSENLSLSPEKFVTKSSNQQKNVQQSQNLPDNLSNNTNDSKETNIISIPYYEDVYASAGDGIINYDEAPVVMDFDKEFLRTFLRISGSLVNLHIINAKGNSMEPTITQGELLFINPLANEGGIISGCIYVVNYEGDIFVKRLERDPITKAITMMSDNTIYKTITIEGENLEKCNVIGRVVAHTKRS